jgi:hypothetical protein
MHFLQDANSGFWPCNLLERNETREMKYVIYVGLWRNVNRSRVNYLIAHFRTIAEYQRGVN